MMLSETVEPDNSSIFVSGCLTIQAVEAVESPREVCAVELIKLFTHFLGYLRKL